MPPKIGRPRLTAIVVKPISKHHHDGDHVLRFEGCPAASPSDKNCRAWPAPQDSLERLLSVRHLQKDTKHAQLGSARHPRAKPPR